MVSTTSQINKFIEFIVVLGDLIILNLVLSFLLFLGGSFVSLPFSCRVSDDDFVKSLLSGLFGPRGEFGIVGNSPRPTSVARVEEYYSFSIFWACIMTFSGISIYSPLSLSLISLSSLSS